jgi:hypothetical protein
MDVTQANTVRMLGLYGRQNQTRKALWELDNLYRTLYILTFIDDVGLRQSVQKALDRGEAYHRFCRAISYVNAGKFRVKTETEQHIRNECSRPIANAVIYDNTLLLSRAHAQKQAAGNHAAADMVKDISPNAWQHVHLIAHLHRFNGRAAGGCHSFGRSGVRNRARASGSRKTARNRAGHRARPAGTRYPHRQAINRSRKGNSKRRHEAPENPTARRRCARATSSPSPAKTRSDPGTRDEHDRQPH